MLDGLAYRSPQLIAALVAVTEERRDVRVLDVGCGLAYSQTVYAHGFQSSRWPGLLRPMLSVAQREGRIEKLFCAI